MASEVFQSCLSQSKILELSKDTRALKEAFEAGDLPAVAAKLQSTLHPLENVGLDIGVTGGTGSGKSTFVNTIRGLEGEDPTSACTGVVEMTVDPTPYPHPKYPNIVIWDLPGIGTHAFRADKYLQRVLLGRYDFFLIITLESFAADHAQLALEIRGGGASASTASTPRWVWTSPPRAAAAPAPSRRRRCSSQSGTTGLKDPKVFLLSMFESGKYAFRLLEESMVRGLESHKRHAFLVALPNVSKPMLERKAASLRQHIWLVAMVACGANPSPVPGWPATCTHTLTSSLEGYRRSFGLDEGSLEPLNVPIPGSLAACGLSFATVYRILHTSLDVDT
ncbi:hypothetical protein E2I00_010164 [Balaenoptera physalus]|uniref:IRG-type G domain-containing protein n=1 Tax=Balaenoptera physalus TaxID=9770 RepID=A0A643BM44_BALPH|nr:hypothetical protein E2I00_010164 [Balaenoptera physalus]